MVTVHTDPPNAVLYHGTYIDLVCTVSISEHVDTNTTITASWAGPLGNISTNSDYNITSSLLESEETFTMRLRIHNLDTGRDDGAAYSCLASVTPSNQDTFVLASSASAALTLNVRGE